LAVIWEVETALLLTPSLGMAPSGDHFPFVISDVSFFISAGFETAA
jgi:hypothetical protein